MKRNSIAWLALALGSACAPVPSAWSIAVGPSLPPLASCTLRVERTPLAEAERRYQRVGAVCLALPGSRGTDDLQRDGDALALLRRHACALGGDIAIANGICSFHHDATGRSPPHDEGAIEYSVFREPTAAR